MNLSKVNCTDSVSAGRCQCKTQKNVWALQDFLVSLDSSCEHFFFARCVCNSLNKISSNLQGTQADLFFIWRIGVQFLSNVQGL